MRRAYPLLLTCLLAAACDEELPTPTVPDAGASQPEAASTMRDAASAVDVRRLPAQSDAAPSDAAPAQLVDSGEATVGRVEAATDGALAPNPLGSGLHLSGQTCFGSADELVDCAPSQCIPGRFSHVNDGSSPYTVDCIGPCGKPWPPMPLYGDELVVYTYRWTQDPELQVALSFDRRFDGATTVEQARAAGIGASFVYSTDLGKPDDPGHETILVGTANAVEVVSFDGRRMRVRGHGEIASATGSNVFAPHPCGAAGDNPFPNPVCLRDNCSYGDSAHGGSGQPAQFDLDVTFDLF